MPSWFYQVIGLLGLTMLVVIVARVLINGLFRIYPWFVCYTAYVLGSSVIALRLESSRSAGYALYYWISQLLALLIGLGVTFEIMRLAFIGFPAIRSAALASFRVLLAAVILRLIASGAAFHSLLVVELERDVRTLQAFMIIVLAGLLLYYSIPLNRNLAGVILGYGVFVCCSVVNLTLRSQLGATFQAVWSFLQPLQYVLCELIWCVCLWKAVHIETVVCENVPQSLAPFSSFEINLRRLRAYLVQGSSGLQ